jgi:hypothetical protein
MCLLKKLFSKKSKEKHTESSEPWFNDLGRLERGDRFKTTTDPYTGKKKKPLMDPIYNVIPGNGQDSNSVKKNGV